jgi:hypothetical protein
MPPFFLFAHRGLRRSPGFALLAIVTLALGIGAATAVFSVVDAFLFRPLARKDPDRLVRVFSRGAPLASTRSKLSGRNDAGKSEEEP